MSTAEYVATFASIVVGLAFADILLSLHRLIRSRRTIRWDWLPIATAVLLLLTIVQSWWKYFEIWTSQPVFTFGQFLPDLLGLTMLFFLSAAVLPDEIKETGVDLKEYYLENRTYFWGLFAAYIVLVSVIKTWRNTGFNGPLMEAVAINSFNLIAVIFMISLMFTRRRWIHAVVVLFNLGFLVNFWVRLTISG